MCGVRVYTGDKPVFKCCPECSNPKYIAERKFHWCGDETKQCTTCGYDLTKRPKIISEDARISGKISLPFSFKGSDGKAYEFLGWEKNDPETKRLVIVAADETKTVLNQKSSSELLSRLKINPYTVPIKHKPQQRKMSPKEWGEYERFKDTRSRLEDMTGELLLCWRNHLEYIRDELGHYDEDETIDEMTEMCRTLPRLMMFIRTSHFPAMEMDDDEFTDRQRMYDEDDIESRTQYYHAYKPTEYIEQKPKKVHVTIQDISDGQL
jgi:hypothetical protein